MDPRPPPGAEPSGGGDGMDRLLAARCYLRSSLDRSRAVAEALDGAGPRLEEIKQRLPLLGAVVRPISARVEALAAVGGRIDRAVGPAAAVLKVFEAVHGLESTLLSDPGPDLHSYLAVLQRLEEALDFLGENCELAVQWLDDIVAYVEENALADGRYVASLRASLHSLRVADSPLDGGLLDAALGRLETEFRRLLGDNSAPLHMIPRGPSSPPMSDGAVQNPPQLIYPPLLPVSVVHNLLAILKRLSANGRLDRCIKIYTEVRAANAKRSLQTLGLDYLEITASEFDNLRSVEGHLRKWGDHMEFAVKHLFEAEYKLCCDVLEPFGPQELWTGSYAKIAAQAGIPAFLHFGRKVAGSKPHPHKLLWLLDIFGTLNRLRPDFNRLFGSKLCVDIRNDTRHLVKMVVDGACEIFWELPEQVESLRRMLPPSDGGVPKLLSVMTEHCNKLLGNEYRPLLAEVLKIHCIWRQETYRSRLLVDSVLAIIKALEQTCESWSKVYEDAMLSYIFLINTHWHFHKQFRGTELGNILGELWLRDHEQYKEYYATLYLGNTWGMLPGLLTREGQVEYSSGGRATARDLVKKRLRAFNEAFDDMYRKHCSCVIPDKTLRGEICQLVVQAVVPSYRGFLQNYGRLVEQDESASRYVRYTAQSMESMLLSLFQHKPSRSVSTQARHSNGMITNNVPTMNQFQSTTVA